MAKNRTENRSEEAWQTKTTESIVEKAVHFAA